MAAVLTLAVTSAAAQDTTGAGAISGVVVNAAGQPAEGVRVCALDTASCATSDARGAFRIGELRAGAYRLEILPLEGLPFTSDPVDVRAGLGGTVEITLPKAENFQQTVTVTAPAFQTPEEVKNSGFLVEPREILKSAAAPQDVSRYVQGLPGVVIGSNDFRNDIIVRGGSPLENLFVVDNVEIPNINAFANFASAGGTVSLLDAELLQDVTFLTVRPHARQRRARAGLRPRRHSRGPHLHCGRAAAQRVRGRAERDQPPQLRQLHLEPPHQQPSSLASSRVSSRSLASTGGSRRHVPVFAAACFIGVIVMSNDTLRAGPAQASLRVGDRFPVLKGQFLSGREAELPRASSGSVALVAMGFTYKSRFPVEAWADWYRTTIDPTTAVTFFEVPMIGGMATLGRWFINRGMRSGTPTELHDQVITVYGGTGDWKQRLSYSRSHEDDAYLIVLDTQGVVRWLHHGAFDQSPADELKGLLLSLADRHPVAAGPDDLDRRREP